MELLQMRYYAAVVQEGSISAAAKKLGLTQPPVSMQMRLLERELGCTLFWRGSRQVRLTEEGRVFYERALRILSLSGSAAAAVKSCRSADVGTLRIGVVSSLADLAVKRWFSGFAARHPGVDLELTEGNTYELLDGLAARALDVALVRTPFSARGFDCVSLAPEPLLLLGTPAQLAGGAKTDSGAAAAADKTAPAQNAGPAPLPAASLADAAVLPLIVYRRWAQLIDRAFAAQGLAPRLRCVADDARTCVSLAEAGLGAAIVPADALAGGLPAGLAARVLEGLSVGAATTLAVNAGGCDTSVGRAFVAYFKADCGLA